MWSRIVNGPSFPSLCVSFSTTSSSSFRPKSRIAVLSTCFLVTCPLSPTFSTTQVHLKPLASISTQVGITCVLAGKFEICGMPIGSSNQIAQSYAHSEADAHAAGRPRLDITWQCTQLLPVRLVDLVMSLETICPWPWFKRQKTQGPRSVNIFFGFFFVVNFCLGTGFLGIPYSFFYAGYLASIPTLLLIAFVSWNTATWTVEVMARAQVGPQTVCTRAYIYILWD